MGRCEGSDDDSNKAFLARIGEFKRTFKRLDLVEYGYFGSFSKTFRMNFVTSGLLNFVNHFSEDLKGFPRFCWWTKCAATCNKLGYSGLS